MLLPLREIQGMPREEVFALAKEYGVHFHGKPLPWIQRKVYESANGLLPEMTEYEREGGFFTARKNLDSQPDEEPEVDTPEDEMRRRLFRLAVELLADELATMTDADIDQVMDWCPTLESGQRADCYTCPLHSMRDCYRRHRVLVE